MKPVKNHTSTKRCECKSANGLSKARTKDGQAVINAPF